MKWYPTECWVCKGDGFHMELLGPQVCRACRGIGRVLAWQTVPPGSLVRMLHTSQPAKLSDPYTTATGSRAHGFVEEGTAVLVIGDRLHEIDKEGDAAKNQAWQGHDVLCVHAVYGLCWLPSCNMEVIA